MSPTTPLELKNSVKERMAAGDPPPDERFTLAAHLA